MSGSGGITLAVIVLGGVCCWFSLAGEPKSGYRADRADYSAETVRSMHLTVAERLRGEGLTAAAEWHERMAGEVGGKDTASDPPAGVEGAEDATEEANGADGAADPRYARDDRLVEADNGVARRQ